MKIAIEHCLCTSCGSVRDEAFVIPRAAHGMDAGIYAYPMTVTEEFVRNASEESYCFNCGEKGTFAFALAPAGEES